MALKVLVLLWCVAWVCEGVAPGQAEEDKHTSVSEAVAIAEEEGTVEDGLRDKRFYSSFPPVPFHPSNYPNFTPEEWEAMYWRNGRGRSDATRSRVPDTSSSYYRGGYTPYPSWYHQRQYPYYPYTRWFPGPHPFPMYTNQGRYDGYCNYPYPHSHPVSSAFTRANQAFQGDNSRGQFGQGNQGFSGTQSGQGFLGENRGQFGQGNQGFTGTQTGQNFPGDERGSQGFSGSTGGQQGFTGGDSNQGFPGDDRKQQGYPDQAQPGISNFPQRDRPSQGGQFSAASGLGSENFPGSDGAGQRGVRPSGGFPGARPGSFPSNMGDDSSSFNQGGSPGGSFNQGGSPGGSFNQGGSPGSPFNQGGPGSSFSPGSSFGQGSPGGSSNQGGPGGSFSPGSQGISFNQGGPGGSFGTGPDSIPMNFGSGGPGSPDPPSNFGFGGSGSSSGPSGFTSITLSSSSSNLGGSQSSSSNTRASSLGSSGGFQSQGSSSAAGFSGFGNEVNVRDTQKAAMDAKNNIKRATPAATDTDSLPRLTA